MNATRLESAARLLLPLGLGLGIAAGLYAFGTEHTPDYSGTALFGQTATDTLPIKSWLATGLLALAALQLGLAMWIYGRLPGVGVAGLGIGNVHRAVGVVAVLVTLPIAYHCAFAYGVQTNIDARVAVAFAGRLLPLRRDCRQADHRPLPALARLGAASSRRHGGRARRRALVHQRALVLQQLQPAIPISLDHCSMGVRECPNGTRGRH